MRAWCQRPKLRQTWGTCLVLNKKLSASLVLSFFFFPFRNTNFTVFKSQFLRLHPEKKKFPFVLKCWQPCFVQTHTHTYKHFCSRFDCCSAGKSVGFFRVGGILSLSSISNNFIRNPGDKSGPSKERQLLGWENPVELEFAQILSS